MAVPEQTPYIEHTGNGITTSFALGFQCDSKNHLIVLVDDVEPPIATWSLTGGNVVFTTAPAAGKKITLQRNTPFSRTTDYQSFNNSFRPQTVNGDFDRLWLKLQELGVTNWLMKLYVDRLHREQKSYIDDQDQIIKNIISDLRNYANQQDDQRNSYFENLISQQGVSLQQLDSYYNHLLQGIANIAIDKGWLASLVVDKSGKNQQQINDISKINYLENYGGGKDILDNTQALISASENGAVVLKSGVTYRFKTNGTAFNANNLIIIGNNTSKIILEKGSSDFAFNIVNADIVKVVGVEISANQSATWNDGLKLINLHSESAIKHFEATGNKFEGNVRLLYGFGSTTRMPLANPYGFNKFIFNDNRAKNIGSTLITLPNYPIWDGEVCDNEASDFHGTFINFGLSNGAANSSELYAVTSVKAHNNKAISSDEHWSVTNGSSTGSNYHCFMLIEGAYVEWIDNKINGLKVDQDGITVCDAYLMCNTVVSHKNDWRNTANFTSGVTTNLLIHAKLDKIGDVTPLKTFTKNTYIIEKEWLKRIGKTTCSHRFFNIGGVGNGNGGDIVIDSNVVNIDRLTSSFNNTTQDFKFTNNKVFCNGLTVVSPAISVILLSIRPSLVGISSFIALNNTLIVKDAEGVSVDFTASGQVNSWLDYYCNDNNITLTKHNGGYLGLAGSAKTKNCEVLNNKLNGGIYYDFYGLVAEKMLRENNTFFGNRSGGQRIGYVTTFKTGYVAQKNIGIISHIRMGVYNDSTTFSGDQTIGCRAKIKIERATGDVELILNYELIWSDNALTVKFISPGDIERNYQVATTTGGGTSVKFTKVGGEDLIISVIFRNTVESTYFEVLGFPDSVCKYSFDVLAI